MNFSRLQFLLLALALITLPALSPAQRYIAESGSIIFLSKATIEDIKSENKKVSSIFNISTGAIAFSVPIRQFSFNKQLMQEHFNDKYMESDRFPTATFSGIITGHDPVSPGVQPVTAKGKLTIHGITKDVDIPGTFQRDNGTVVLKSTFKIKLLDYEIRIPKLLWQNIAEQVDITLDMTYKPH